MRSGGFRAFLRTTVIIAVCAACLWYVVAPPKGTTAYRERMASSTQTLLSQVQTTRLWARAVTDDDTINAAALVAFKETESDASSATSQFERFEVPPGTQELREEYTKVGDETTSTLAEFRISAEQERWEDIAALADELPSLIKTLEEFEQRAKP